MPDVLLLETRRNDVRSTAEELLAADCHVAVAGSASRALELAEVQRPDCIVLDLATLEGDGYEICRLLKADDRLRNVPLIMVAAAVDVEGVKKGLEAGADDCVAHPFDFHVVWARLQASLQIKQAHAIVVKTNCRLAKACREAEKANAAKSLFLANTSHEIRTPMAAILGFAELLGGSLDGERRELALTIHRNAVYLQDLIDDILDFSKIEAGQLDVERVPCDPREILAQVVELIGRRIPAGRDVCVSADVDSALPRRIVTDPTRLRQILTNLLSNAVKFTDEGTVTVRATMMRRSGMRRMVRFEVADTGIGLTTEQMARLCRPFAQADASTWRKYGGNGLGLSISKRLVGLLGGELSLSSIVGEGTRVIFTIDPGLLDGVEYHGGHAAPANHPTVRAAEMETELPRLAGRILLVEDGPDNQRLFGHILRTAGAHLTVADDGRAAVEMVTASLDAGAPFDLVLMDMQLPEVDGYQASRMVRDLGYRSPIIALTAYAMTADRRKCIASGCDDYLAKPIDRRALLCAVARHLNERALRVPAVAAEAS